MKFLKISGVSSLQFLTILSPLDCKLSKWNFRYIITDFYALYQCDVRGLVNYIFLVNAVKTVKDWHEDMEYKSL